jgi:hypothetical protein
MVISESHNVEIRLQLRMGKPGDENGIHGTFLVMFNGSPTETFKPTRGIRQGDPISSHLFLLAAEGLLCLLKSRSVLQSSSLQGLKVASTAPAVNHLLFADDSLVCESECGGCGRSS